MRTYLGGLLSRKHPGRWSGSDIEPPSVPPLPFLADSITDVTSITVKYFLLAVEVFCLDFRI